MTHAKPLPDDLVQRFRTWKADTYQENKALFEKLGQGQQPPVMMISCCDSRVHPASLFGVQQGQFFGHRNIANFVPPASAAGDNTGTAAAVQYAVMVLKVKHVVVMGHSACGGVQGCIDMCQGKAPGLEADDSFVGKWINNIKPHYDAVADIDDPKAQATALEKHATLVSLENLMSYSFVRDAVEDGVLTLHAAWNDIASGSVEVYDADADGFVAL